MVKKHARFSNAYEAFFYKNILKREVQYEAACCGGCDDNLSAIDLAALEAELGGVTIDVSQQLLFQKFVTELPGIITPVTGRRKDSIFREVMTTLDTSITRPWTCDFTPVQGVEYKPFDNYARGIAGDMQICPGELYNTYFSFLLSQNFEPAEYPFALFIHELLINRAKEDLRLTTLFHGVYNSAGTAPIDTFDGYHTIIGAAITAGDITPITLGAFTPGTTDAVEYIESFVDGFPVQWRGAAVDIWVPMHIYTAF